MLRTDRPNGADLKADKGISIITNFGCSKKCWYCIWNEHPLKDVKSQIEIPKVLAFLHDHREYGKVSISGGGDPLRHPELFNVVLSWCRINNMLVDVHTRVKRRNNAFWKQINRCVFSSDIITEDVGFLEYAVRHTEVRIVHVLTKESTPKLVTEFVVTARRLGCQLSFKELVGHDDGGAWKRVRRTLPGEYFIPEGDYNRYFMPDNTVTNVFLELGS